MLPYASIIIPTYRRPNKVAACLRSLTELAYPQERFEVLLIDDGSPEPLDSVVEPFRSKLPLRLIRQANSGPAVARNNGLRNARGELVAFTDDDCRPQPNWLRHLAEAFEREPEAALGGAIVNSLSENSFSEASQLLVDYLRDYYQTTGRNGFFTSNNLAFPTRVLREFGGFDESFGLACGEDREICDRWLQQRRKLIYVPEAVVLHGHNLTLRSFVRQHFNYGKGSHHFHRLHARNSGKKVRVEPVSFYRDLMFYPFRVQPATRAVPATVLFAVSQAANAAGFFWQAYNESVNGKTRV